MIVTGPCRACHAPLPDRRLAPGAAFCEPCRAAKEQGVVAIGVQISKAEAEAKGRVAAASASEMRIRQKEHPAKCNRCGVVVEGGWGVVYCVQCRLKIADEMNNPPPTVNDDAARWANLPSLRDREPKTFDSLRPRLEVAGLGEAADTVRGWCYGLGRPWVTLIGPPRVGKSHLAEAAIRHIVARHQRGRWENVAWLLDRLRKQGDDDGDRSLALVAATPYLVLDDLDKVRPTDWALERLYMLIESRAHRERRTLVTTNEGRESLARRLGDEQDMRAWSVATRVFDGVLTAVCVIDGPSYQTEPP